MFSCECLIFRPACCAASRHFFRGSACADLVEEVARVVEISHREGAAVVKTVLGTILQALREGGRVEIRRFRTFATRQRGGRMARNPRTGERVVVGPKKVAFFKPGKELKEVIQRTPETRPITEKPP